MGTRATRQRGAGNWRLHHLPVLLTVNGALSVVVSVTGWLVDGQAAAAGGFAGVATVAASYLLSTLVIAWADGIHSSLVLPFGLVTYVVKFTVIGMVMAPLAASGWSGLPAMGVGVVAGVLGWTATQIWWVTRHPPRLAYQSPDRRHEPQ